jgi:hypothetical protein
MKYEYGASNTAKKAKDGNIAKQYLSIARQPFC